MEFDAFEEIKCVTPNTFQNNYNPLIRSDDEQL